MELPFDFKPQKEPSRIKEVRRLERELGLETAGQRALEASLFIDKKFLDVAVITGEATPPELLFGDKEWEGYLGARLFARQNINQGLSIDLIKALHEKISQPVKPNIAGKVRDTYVRAGNYNDPSQPVEYTEQEIETIKQNPLLMFEPVDGTNKGFIHYPFTKDGQNIQQHIEVLLQEVCDWYNSEINKKGNDPYKLAALLQRKIISIHPFLDANGTTSRVLMNWSLEKSGIAPSAIDNPSSDILTSEDEWIQAIRNGNKKYEESRNRLKALEEGKIEDLAFALGIAPEKAFYDYIFRFIGKPPAFFSNNGMQDHQTFESFFNQFIQELTQFQSFLQTATKIGDKEIIQGGLISEAYIKFLSKQGRIPEATSDLFFTDVNLFRGGSLDIDQIDDLHMIQLMTSYTGVGTGYRALARSYMSPLSGDTASRQQIQESAEYFNKIMAKHYLGIKHPSISAYGQDVQALPSTIKGHVAGGENAWISPFVSTSFGRRVSESFAGGLAKYGVLFSLRAPREGVVLSFKTTMGEGLDFAEGVYPHEKEGLIAGGVNPEAIQEIRVYEGHKDKIPLFIVKKRQGQITINDLRAAYVVTRTYAYDSSTGQYQFKEEVQTKTPSAQLAQDVPQEEPVEAKPYKWINDFDMFDLQTNKLDILQFSELSKKYKEKLEFINQDFIYENKKDKEVSKKFEKILSFHNNKDFKEDKISLFDNNIKIINTDKFFKENKYSKDKNEW